MGQVSPEVDGLVRRLKGGIRVDLVLAFGSRARGDWLLDSDVDLLIVSPDFKGRHFTERAEDVLRLWKGTVPLDPICLTPDEFRERSRGITIIREASTKGVQVYP